MILPRCISSPVAKRLFLPFYEVPIRLKKMAVHQENFQNFVIFDYHPGEMVWNMEKWQA